MLCGVSGGRLFVPGRLWMLENAPLYATLGGAGRLEVRSLVFAALCPIPSFPALLCLRSARVCGSTVILTAIAHLQFRGFVAL